jgi:hypothetical protein
LSGSRNARDKDTVRAPSFALSESAANVPTAAGGRLATVTSNDSDADKPPGSVAVKVNVAKPPDTGVTVMTAPAADALATAVFDEATVMVRTSLSGSVNARDKDTIRAPSFALSESAANVPTAAGGRFATATSNDCDTDKPPGSVAVKVNVVTPPDSGVTVTTAPAADALATAVFDEATVMVRTSR